MKFGPIFSLKRPYIFSFTLLLAPPHLLLFWSKAEDCRFWAKASLARPWAASVCFWKIKALQEGACHLSHSGTRCWPHYTIQGKKKKKPLFGRLFSVLHLPLVGSGPTLLPAKEPNACLSAQRCALSTLTTYYDLTPRASVHLPLALTSCRYFYTLCSP